MTLIPMFFMILMWGGEDRKYAAMKFFIYTFSASVVMLIGILIMYFYTTSAETMTGHTFDMIVMITNTELIRISILSIFH